MGVDPTIVSLACQIAKLKQWGKAWERTAAAKKEEIVELRTKLSLEVESLREEIAGLRGIVKERDGLLTQAQDQRAEIERLGKQLNGLYLQMEMRRSVDATALAEARREGEERAAEGLQSRVQDMRDEIIRVNEAHGKTQAERDALRAEVAALQERLRADIAKELNESPPMPTIKRSHPVKVGEWVRRTSEPYGGVSIGTIGKVLGFAAEHYSIAVEQCWYFKWYFKYCEPCDPPGSTHAEPDLTQLHAKGKEAWSDVPNATQWVEDMRGNTEASHDTPAGKEAAEAVVRDSQMTDTHDCGPNCPHCSW